jgi:DNA-binding CsgD family transcriptional regulator
LSSQFLLERLRSQVAALEAIGVAACVVSGAGTLQAANPKFEAELGHLTFDMRTGVQVADKEANRLLANALEALRRKEFNGCSIALRSAEAGGARVLHLLPVRGEANDLFVRASALLVISDPQKLIDVPNGLLHSLFDLTPAESRLAARLCHPDSSPKVIAAENGVSLHTVRAQLKSILAKTGAAGQVDLVRMLLGAATL